MKLVMFDYDGVLVDSFPLLKKIYRKISNVMGMNLPEKDEFYRELIELDYRETYRKLNIDSKDKVNISEFLFHFHSKKDKDKVKLYPDIPEVLEKLSQKYILAVVTNNFRKELEYRLKEFNIAKYFSAVFTEEDGELKPHPDLLQKCMAKFNITPKDACFVGDMDGDITAGKKAKVSKVIAVTYGYHLKYRLKDADIIIDHPKELLQIL